MRRVDLISFEKFVADTYRREASNRRSKNAALATQLDGWAEASERRIEALRCGPLFVAEES